MPSTCSSETTTLASRCRGSCRCQVSQWNGNLRVVQTTSGTSASHARLLDHSHASGSQAAKPVSSARMSISTVTLLATALNRVIDTQNPISTQRRHGWYRSHGVLAESSEEHTSALQSRGHLV